MALSTCLGVAERLLTALHRVPQILDHVLRQKRARRFLPGACLGGAHLLARFVARRRRRGACVAPGLHELRLEPLDLRAQPFSRGPRAVELLGKLRHACTRHRRSLFERHGPRLGGEPSCLRRLSFALGLRDAHQHLAHERRFGVALLSLARQLGLELGHVRDERLRARLRLGDGRRSGRRLSRDATDRRLLFARWRHRVDARVSSRGRRHATARGRASRGLLALSHSTTSIARLSRACSETSELVTEVHVKP